MNPTKLDSFLNTYYPHQVWSLPKSIIYNITKYPSSPIGYEKLIQTCKYFFIKNSLLVVPRLSLKHQNSKWQTFFDSRAVDMHNISSKIWATYAINIKNSFDNRNDQHFFTIHFYQCNVKELILEYQNISYTNLKTLTSKCQKLSLKGVLVVHGDGSVVGLKEVVQDFPNIKEFRFSLHPNFITAKTASELLEIPHFSNLEKFVLMKIPEAFDIDTFYIHIKKNKKTEIALDFVDYLSEQYKNRLNTIVKEIILSKTRDYLPPCISFGDMNPFAYTKLNKLYRQHFPVFLYSSV